MRQTGSILCPSCHTSRLVLKYAVTYEYSYAIDANAPGEANRSEFLPYLYDSREQKESRQYIQCQTCGASFPCCFDHWNQGISAEALQNAINAAGGI